MGSTVFATVSTPGPPGPTGPPGRTAVWYVNPGVPSNSTGLDGDMYLNNTTGDVYGPKAGGAWGPIVANIKGPTGATGYSPQYIVAAGAPTSGIGNNGDMYINSNTSDVYGPKSAGAWGPIVCNIKGATGATGPQGPPGNAATPKGQWLATTTYVQSDEVTNLNILYISLQAGNLGNTPASSPTWWQALGASPQTPWQGDIDGATHKLKNTGNVGIGNDGTLPYSPTAYPALIVGPTTATTACGYLVACGNAAASGAIVGAIAFANYNTAVAEKRVAVIQGMTDGTADAGALVFTTIVSGAANERVRITSGGNVGIGTTGPNAQLQVVGPSNTGINTAGIVSIATATAGPDELILGVHNGDYSWMQAVAPGVAFRNLVLQPNAGNVGIGTTNPGTPLSFGPLIGSGTTPTIGLYDNGAYKYGIGTFMGAQVNMGFWVFNNTTPAVTIDYTGKMGIGTTNPLQPLSIIAGTPTTAATSTQLSIGEATNNSQYRLTLGYGSISGPGWAGCIQATAGGSGYALLLNPNGGNVGIGKTTPTFILDVAGNVNCTSGYYVNGVAIAGSAGIALYAQCSVSFLAGTGALQDVPGCSLTLSPAGRWLITGFFDMTCVATFDTVQGSLNVNGATQAGAAVGSYGNGNVTRGTCCQQWVVVVAVNIVAKLQFYRSQGTDARNGVNVNTTITALWVSAS